MSCLQELIGRLGGGTGLLNEYSDESLELVLERRPPLKSMLAMEPLRNLECDSGRCGGLEYTPTLIYTNTALLNNLPS